MVIAGTILEVMETWPLQISIDTGERTWHVALDERAGITSEGQPADVAQLLPNRWVRVEGEAANAGAMKAVRVDIGAFEG